ncbi:DUF1345 domain-containing protein [Dyella soli]|uniref:DUF1345 domain-containing protein n=1 Tax=Dyella soli TaxID=522319 RepID=A0A4R0YUX9_9GAMM|nr:DUF1345 domain-containing protein [Dyella soli]TCI10668.1 DUF1345 domain-containing protein [Dyella soli]
MNVPGGKPSPHGNSARHWLAFHNLRARPRLVVSAVIFVLVSLVLWRWGHLNPHKALLVGFDVGVLIYLVALATLFNQARTPGLMHGEARKQDTGRWGVLWAGVGLTAFVAMALTTEVGAARGGDAEALVIAAASIVLSWLFMNILFAMHYAHGFYGDFGKQHEGLEFPGTEQPDYWDFAYFAIVIGMTFQVSDVQITSRYLRRVALLHSVIAFFFNVFIIAISVNIAAGLAG